MICSDDLIISANYFTVENSPSSHSLSSSYRGDDGVNFSSCPRGVMNRGGSSPTHVSALRVPLCGAFCGNTKATLPGGFFRD